MKFTATAIAIIVALSFLAYTEAGIANVPEKIRFQHAVAAASGDNCKCIPWTQCHGDVNPDVYCRPWYGMTCCIISNRPTKDQA